MALNIDWYDVEKY